MITITQPDASQLKTLMEQQGLADLGLRVFVAPGGCSGFQYGMRFEDAAMDGDEITALEGIQVYVDEFSAQYLEGAQIDFVDSLMGGGFTVHNPQAVSNCSCGQSFTSAAGDGAPRPCGA